MLHAVGAQDMEKQFYDMHCSFQDVTRVLRMTRLIFLSSVCKYAIMYCCAWESISAPHLAVLDHQASKEHPSVRAAFSHKGVSSSLDNVLHDLLLNLGCDSWSR